MAAEQKLIEQFNLRSRLRFNVDDGQIWLDENRMLLLHARSMGALRREQRRAKALPFVYDVRPFR